MSDALVERVKRAIARRPERNVTLDELAHAVHCSPFRLCRAFRRATGQTITSYRHSLRILAALERLGGETTLTDLALDLGFSSHSHFTAVFRRHLGITPSELRGKEMPRPVPPEARQCAG